MSHTPELLYRTKLDSSKLRKTVCEVGKEKVIILEDSNPLNVGFELPENKQASDYELFDEDLRFFIKKYDDGETFRDDLDYIFKRYVDVTKQECNKSS